MLQYEAALVVPTSHKGFLGGTLVKNPPANAEDVGSIPGSGRPPGEATHSSILTCKIPWTEEPGGLPSVEFPKQEY